MADIRSVDVCEFNRDVSLCLDVVQDELMSRTKNNYYNIVSLPLYCSTKFACNFTPIFPIISVIIFKY